MTLFDRIGEILERARAASLGAAMAFLEARRERRDAAVFSIALIALSAKMAGADGQVRPEERAAFARVFSYRARDAGRVRALFDLAMTDVAGFESYARQVAAIYKETPSVLEDVYDCLYFIATADGRIHPAETELLDSAADIFALGQAARARIKCAHEGADENDPYTVLGLEPDADRGQIRRAYLTLVRKHHPDALMARGVPAHLVRISHRRMAAINDAYGKLKGQA